MTTLQEMVAEISKRATARAAVEIGAGIAEAATTRTDPPPTIVADDERVEKTAEAVEYIVGHFDELFSGMTQSTPAAREIPKVASPRNPIVARLREKLASAGHVDTEEQTKAAELRTLIERKLNEVGNSPSGDPGSGTNTPWRVKTAASGEDKRRLMDLIRGRQAAGAKVGG